MSDLRIVHDADLIPISSLSDIPGDLRKLADAIEAGNYDEPTHVLVLIDTSDSMFMELMGKSATGYETAGRLQFAIRRLCFDD